MPCQVEYPKLNPAAKRAIVAQLKSGNYTKGPVSYYRDEEGNEYFNIIGVIRNTFCLAQGYTERTRDNILNGNISARTRRAFQQWLGNGYMAGLMPVGQRKDGTYVTLYDVQDGYRTRIMSFAKMAELIDKRL
jgi:hypothetical protein